MMATKYAGQNALNKLMQIIKTALANKADKVNATTSAAGLMSAADKTKLDGIAEGANKTIVDSALSASSMNPVQNKAVKGALDDKADKTALDDKLDKTGGTITGNLKVTGNFEPEKGLTTNGGINAQSVSTPVLALHDNGVAGANASLNVAGAGVVEVTVPDGDKRANARMKVGTPTEDDDATTKAYVDSKIAAGGVTVDAEMSDDSTNPVQNKVVKKYVDDNLAGSGAVRYDATQELTFEQKQRARKNIDAAATTGPDFIGEVDLCPEKITDGNTAVHVNVTDEGNGKFQLTLECGPEYDRTRVSGIRTPVDTQPYDAVNVEYVKNKVSGLQTADQVQSAINSAISGVYTPKGSIAFASLPTAAGGNKGWVYNVTDAFTTTAAFVEGAGHAYGAGTNVVCVDAGSGSYKWDVLAGTIDLTELTAAEVQTLWDSI